MITVHWPKWSKLVNDSFVPLMHCRDRIIIMYGGRGSSKSVAAAKKLIYRCLSEKFFRFILYRKTHNTIKDSQWQTLKDCVDDMGLSELFTFKTSPLEVVCYNGNKFIARGGDQPKKLKSIKDPTGVWYEEEIPEEDDFITITSSIRTTRAAYLQEVFTINPEVEGDYTQHWFWKRFFEGHDEKTFRSTMHVDVNGKLVERAYTCHHSTFLDNRWLPDSFAADLLSLQQTNEYYYTIYALGLWGIKLSKGTFYKLFKYGVNVVQNKQGNNGKPELYDPALPLHITFDFNLNPFVTLNVWQIKGKKAIQIDEICLVTPHNRTQDACREFTRRYSDHTGGLFIYGDPNGKKEDSSTEKGYNNYVLIKRELAKFRPTERVDNLAPPVAPRGNFINTIFSTGYNGISLHIGSNCVKTIMDYMHLKEAQDGTKLKEKWENPQTEKKEEKYGHTSDANDYLICRAFSSDFALFQKGGVHTKHAVGRNAVTKNTY